MRYEYFVAYKIRGVTPPPDGEEQLIVEYPDGNSRARVVYDVNKFLGDIDRRSAIGALVLKGLFGGLGSGSLDERIDTELDLLRIVRTETIGAGVFLTLEGKGDIGNLELSNQRELPNCVVAFCDGNSTLDIRSKYAPIVNGLLTSFALAFETVDGLTRVADGVIFRTSADKPLYAYSLTGSATVSVSRELKVEPLEFVAQHSKTLALDKGSIDPSRLLVKSLASDGDNLLAFLSAWDGLEIFVNKNFRDYEDAAFGRLSGPEKFIGRIRHVMNDKYRLTDKFSLIAFELSKDADVTVDVEIFQEIKEMRDKLLHGVEIDSSKLPTEKTRTLLRKYLRLRIQTIGA
jgi:hypothetical protein